MSALDDLVRSYQQKVTAEYMNITLEAAAAKLRWPERAAHIDQDAQIGKQQCVARLRQEFDHSARLLDKN